jgi:hypothetical protein
MTAPDIAYNNHFGGCCFEEIGTAYQHNSDRDLLLINARGSVLMFDGGPVSSVTKRVHSWGYRITGELLCTSGSKSGIICGDRTQSGGSYTVHTCDSDGDCYTMHNFAKAININGQSVGQPGDSGAPVFSLDGDGVRAKGSLTARESSNHAVLYYQDMDDIVGTLGTTPITA